MSRLCLAVTGGCSGHRFHLGTNKEVSDAEVFAIYRALLWFEGLQGTGRRFTIFADSTAAIERVRTDALGPAQRFATAAIEVCGRIHDRGDQVTIPWVPSYVGAEGNETANRYAKAAADWSVPCRDEATPPELIDEASLSYMARTATEARYRATTEWITDNVRTERRYRPPPPGGSASQTAGRHTEGASWPFLPAPVRTCEHRVFPSQDRNR